MSRNALFNDYCKSSIVVDVSIFAGINDTYIMREEMNNIAVNWVLVM